MNTIPKTFLSYGSEDKELAKKIAEELVRNGIDTWWDRWEIRAGDSLRQKIEIGLRECTHFVVLLTETSITKPWVNEEIDAGFVQMISDGKRLIPLRHRLSVERLPALLRGKYSPEINGPNEIKSLVDDIFGITVKPPLGNPPKAATMIFSNKYSAAANTVARFFVESSKNGIGMDVQVEKSELMKSTGLSRDDLTDAIDELKPHIKNLQSTGGSIVFPNSSLYYEFDSHFMDWNVNVDARRLAADLFNDESFPSQPKLIADRYGWPPRRLNPAVEFLVSNEILRAYRIYESDGYRYHNLTRTEKLRRFVKSS